MKQSMKTEIKDKSLIATAIISAVMVMLFLVMYAQVVSIQEARCLQRMEEGVATSIEEVTSKLKRDSNRLNATANILLENDTLDTETIRATMAGISPLMETMFMCVLMPDNTIIEPGDRITDGTGKISFEELSKMGEHVSDRMTTLLDGNTYVLRHYVPLEKNGKVAAILYGVTSLKNLPKELNIENIYNASASVFLIDMSNGDFLMNPWNEQLGNINETKSCEVRGTDLWENKIAELLNGKQGYMIYRSNQDGEWAYLYYAPSGINDWAIAVSVPEKEAFANLFSIQKIFMITACFMAISIFIYYIWVYRNTQRITERAVERAVLEEKLHKAEASERAKTVFLSNMSHDIRTPMNAIIGFTTLAETNIDNKDRVRDYLSKILSSSNHLLSLINDILDMSRIESGRLNIEEKEGSISDIFKDMRNIIQTQMESKQINFFMDTIDVVDEEIYCDKLHLNQILLNLLGNAIKFTPAGGTVSLSIRQLHGAPKGYGSYEIRVKDTGIGMSEEFVKNIFEPFEREQTSTVSGIQGTGLGMPITKSIVEEMGGTIDVKTEQGKGTEFIVRLDFRLVSERKQIEVIRELEGLRALVADDNFTTCDSVTKMMRQIGMRSEWTMRGNEAVLRARQAIEMGDAFCAYIIDWKLPDLSGIEIARQIREIAGADAPIIILTAYDWSLIEDEARDAGVTAFCNKPIFLSDLRDILAEAIGAAGAEQPAALIPEAQEELIGKRLLLVEDIALNRELAEEILKESGFVVETAENGKVAVEMVEKSPPGYYDLILMDVQMPVMNGYDATRAIRALDDPAHAGIPIVAMTANAFEEDRKAALESGMNAHVSKPIDVAKFMEVISSLLGKQKADGDSHPSQGK